MYANLDIEKVLLQAAAAIQRSGRLESNSSERVIAALQGFSPKDNPALAAVVGFFLTAPDKEVQANAAKAIGRMSINGSDFVPQLAELANKPDLDPTTSGAFLVALGQIATPEAISFLIDSLRVPSRPDCKYIFVALGEAGSAADRAIGPVNQLIYDSALDQTSYKHARECLTKIRRAIRYRYANLGMLNAAFEHMYISPSHYSDRTAYEYFARFSTPINLEQEGLIHQGPLRYISHWGKQSEVDIKIYSRPQGGVAAVIGSPELRSNIIENLATSALHILDLNPRKTVWVEYCSASTTREKEYCREVRFEWDGTKGLLLNPAWRSESTLRQVLTDFGIPQRT